MGPYRFRMSGGARVARAALLAGCTLLATAVAGGVDTAYAQGAGSGQPAKKPLTDAQKKAEAKRLYGEANAAYDRGEFDKAYQLFNDANNLVPGAVPKFRAAESLDKAGKVQGAISAYQAFLASNPAPEKYQDRIDSAKKRIAVLEQTPAKVKLVVSPPDATNATVLVDGAPQTGVAFEVPPGKHVITVQAPGYEDAVVEQTFTYAEERDVPVELKKSEAATPPIAPATPPPATTPPPEPEDGGGTSRVPAYITLGLAGAGLVVGTIFGISALSSNSDYEDNPTQDAFDSTERNALISDMAFGASIAFGVTGVVLLLTADDGADAEAAKVLPAKRAARGDFVAPYVTPNGAGAAARLSF
jgi:hypothetical protein